MSRSSHHGGLTEGAGIPAPRVRPPSRWPYRMWRGTVAFLAAATAGAALAGLVAVRDHAAAGWKAAFNQFRWAVLVTGDQIEIDEIGRYLKQLDGVDEVTFLPSGAIIDRLRREPLLENHLNALEAARLPSIWQVTWLPGFNLDSIADTVSDLGRLPGVVDVAFEQRELDKIRFFRGTWLKTRLVLAGGLVLATIGGAILFGRFLFFTNLRSLRAGRSVELILPVALGWLMGLALSRMIVGPFSWHLAWGGLLVGAARLAAAHTRRIE